jgi:hypothetical protein
MTSIVPPNFGSGTEGPAHEETVAAIPARRSAKTHGRRTAVQLGIHGMGAGQGRGLVLIDMAAWERTLR